MDDNDLHSMLTALWESPADRSRFHAHWTQGRSAYGGLACAFAVTAMRKRLAEPLPLRSLLASFVGPIAAGDIAVSAAVRRQGRNVTQTYATIAPAGAVALETMAVFGKARPALRVPAEDAALPPKAGVPLAEGGRLPNFLRHFEGYWVDGALPFSGRQERRLRIWVRHRKPVPDFPAERLIALADMPPPVILSWFTAGKVPASSVTWSLEFVLPPEEVSSEWLLLDFNVEAAAAGYTQQSGRLYDEQGRLCLLSRQCMAYFG